jgi:hypothetical protein
VTVYFLRVACCDLLRAEETTAKEKSLQVFLQALFVFVTRRGAPRL